MMEAHGRDATAFASGGRRQKYFSRKIFPSRPNFVRGCLTLFVVAAVVGRGFFNSYPLFLDA
jgi:hypothetical protein